VNGERSAEAEERMEATAGVLQPRDDHTCWIEYDRIFFGTVYLVVAC